MSDWFCVLGGVVMIGMRFVLLRTRWMERFLTSLARVVKPDLADDFAPTFSRFWVHLVSVLGVAWIIVCSIFLLSH